MKRIISIIAVIALLLAPSMALAVAGSCTQTAANTSNPTQAVITFTCTGSSVDGSIPNTATSTANTAYIDGLYLYSVTAHPTTGGTAPDAADVFVLDAAGEDLLGSVDGGTTANKGLNLIHATLTKTTMPYSHYLAMHYFPIVTGALTLRVSNQATISANYTIVLKFTR